MADIVLRDRNGNQVEYPGVESIKLNTVGGGTKEFIDPDTVPQAVEKTIDPDFSAGDMEVIPEDGQVFSKVGISKPSNLLPGNIAEGVDIAGIVGNLASNGDGKTLSFTKVLTLNYEPPDSSYVSGTYRHQIVSSDELATVGIDLTQYNNWYSEGQLYIPVIYLKKLNTSIPTANPYNCIETAYLSNVPGLKEGVTWRVGYTYLQGTDGYTITDDGFVDVKKSLEHPLTFSISASSITVDSNGNVCVNVLSNKYDKHCLNGTYILVVLLAPLL